MKTKEDQVTISNIKYLSFTDARQLGIVHEINRLLLHPIGFAIDVGEDIVSKQAILKIQDLRDDPEGSVYHRDVLSREKAECFAKLTAESREVREFALGFFIQPLPGESK